MSFLLHLLPSNIYFFITKIERPCKNSPLMEESTIFFGYDMFILKFLNAKKIIHFHIHHNHFSSLPYYFFVIHELILLYYTLFPTSIQSYRMFFSSVNKKRKDPKAVLQNFLFRIFSFSIFYSYAIWSIGLTGCPSFNSWKYKFGPSTL